MASFEERIFQIGRDALADQERHVADTRSRAPALLAAGAVVPSLLAQSVFAGPHPHGFAEVVCAVAGALGGLILLVATLTLLLPYQLGFSLNVTRTYQELWNQDVLEQPGIDLVLADALEDRRAANQKIVDQLRLCLRVAVLALAVEVAGLATAAALAS